MSEKTPYSPIAIDTDEHQPSIFGFIDPETNRLSELTLNVGKKIIIEHHQPVLYQSTRDIRPELLEAVQLSQSESIFSYYVLGVKGIFQGLGTIANANITLSLTDEKFSPTYKIQRDFFNFVLYPEDRLIT